VLGSDVIQIHYRREYRYFMLSPFLVMAVFIGGLCGIWAFEKSLLCHI